MAFLCRTDSLNSFCGLRQRISNPLLQIPDAERAVCKDICTSPVVITSVAIGAIGGGCVGGVFGGPVGAVGGACLGGFGGFIFGVTIEGYRHSI